ncbi:MAG: AAA family ATPase [Thiotrichales bacterium]|nr:AAA family ATPase [Thiotrichales bacterium]
MYRPYFGLTQLPFKITPELDMFYSEGSREEILQALKYTIERGDGILKVVGEVGCGKTMLLRLLAHSLNDHFKLIYVNSPNLSAKDILLFICNELGMEVNTSEQKYTLVHLMQQRLLEYYAQGRRVVMLIDEAQAMTLDGLEEIRLLSNLETDSDKLLQIVLFGQPELDNALEHPNIRQLKSRISYNIYIPPLSAVDVLSYLNFRMRKSGYRGIDVFSPAIAKRIHKLTNGYPRAINVLADKLLMAAFSRNDKQVKKTHFKDLESTFSNNRVNPFALFGGLALLFLIVSFGVFKISEHPSFAHLVMTSTESVAMVQKPMLEKGSSTDDSELNSSSVANDDMNEELFIVEPIKPILMADLSAEETQPIAIQEFNTQLDPVEEVNNLKFNDNPLLNGFFENSSDWINQLTPSGYAVQLATIAIHKLPNYKKVIEKNGLLLDRTQFILDYRADAAVYRLKVYYGQADTYDKAQQVLNQLPKPVQNSKPFIVPFSEIRKGFEKTLNQGGGSDVNPKQIS